MRRTILGLLIAAGALCAQSSAIRLDSLDALAAKAKESANISLPPELIKLAAGLASTEKGKGGPELESLLSGLKSISVRALEFDGRGKYQMSDLAPILAQLTTAAGWSKIVSAKENDELAEVYVRMEQGRIVGLTVIAAEPEELAVINIDGPIDLTALKSLEGLGVPDVSSLLPPGLKQNPKQNQKQDQKTKTTQKGTEK